MKNQEATIRAWEKLIGIVEELRGENGCPWDKAQTHGSIRMELIEEAYEAADAMRRFEENGSFDNLLEELGDVLLHVVIHGVIAEEEGIFTLEDIAEGISQKMIHRHPHVFGQKTYKAEEREKTWEELKAEEKNHSLQMEGPLRQLPMELPALIKAVKILKRIDHHYGERIGEETSMEQLLWLAGQLPGVSTGDLKEKILVSMLYHMANVAFQEKIDLEKGLMDRMNTIINTYEPEGGNPT